MYFISLKFKVFYYIIYIIFNLINYLLFLHFNAGHECGHPFILFITQVQLFY